MGAISKPTGHWKSYRKSKANPDHLNHGHLLNAEASEKADRDVFRSPCLKIIDASIGLTKSRESPKGEEMLFLHFAGQSKKLGLNSTACQTLESLTGTGVPMRWIGTTIQLYVDPQAQYPGGKKGPAIRIRPTVPKEKAETEALPSVPDETLARLEEEQARLLGHDREPGEEG